MQHQLLHGIPEIFQALGKRRNRADDERLRLFDHSIDAGAFKRALIAGRCRDDIKTYLRPERTDGKIRGRAL
jgi:hypothetical protein